MYYKTLIIRLKFIQLGLKRKKKWSCVIVLVVILMVYMILDICVTNYKISLHRIPQNQIYNELIKSNATENLCPMPAEVFGESPNYTFQHNRSLKGGMWRPPCESRFEEVLYGLWNGSS